MSRERRPFRMSRVVLMLVTLLPAQVVAAQRAGVRLEPVAEIRPEEGTGGALGNVSGLVVRRDGSVLVAEQSPARIIEFAADGSFRRLVAREGSGPGEVRMPQIALASDTLVVFDPPAARVSWISPAGRVLRSVQVPVTAQGGAVWTTQRGEVLLEAHFVLPDRSRNAYRIAATGRIDTVRWFANPDDDLAIDWQGPGWRLRGRTPFAPSGVATFDPMGRLILGGSRRSRWVIVSGADTVGRVSLSSDTPAIRPAIRDSVWEEWYGRLPKNLPKLDDVVTKRRFPTRLPPWVSLDVDAGGLWWVGRPDGTGTLDRWDLVDHGRTLGTVRVPAPLIQRRIAGPVVAYGNPMVGMLHETPTGLPWIGVYRLRR